VERSGTDIIAGGKQERRQHTNMCGSTDSEEQSKAIVMSAGSRDGTALSIIKKKCERMERISAEGRGWTRRGTIKEHATDCL
jgi:hypothetical protein